MTDIKRNGDNPLDATTANKPDNYQQPIFSQPLPETSAPNNPDLSANPNDWKVSVVDLREALQPLIDRIELLESITDQSCGCNGIDHEIKG